MDTEESGAVNMARDHALAACLPEGEAVLRLYSWTPSTISFGRNEPASGLYDLERAASLGLDFVRRPTGGRAVVHADEVTYAVVAPLRAFGSLREGYRRINEGLVNALRALGAPATAATGGSALPPDAGPCFQEPADGEVMAGGGKLVGSAQARVEGALLQHGSIILGGSQAVLGTLRGDADAGPEAATLRAWSTEVARDDVAEAVFRALEVALGGCWTEGGYTSYELEEAERLRADRYALDTWTWRR